MLIFYGHPFSSYSWKGQIALYEKGLDFEYRNIDPEFPEHGEQLHALWPVAKFPLLIDGERTLFETSIIIEYLDRIQPEPRLIPADPDAMLRVRQMDRVFDLHVMAVMQEIVNDRIRGPEGHAPMIVAKAKAALDTVYAWLDKELAGDGWATPAGFTLADCAAAPSLFYADWVHEIPAKYENLRAYRARLLARPSVARAVDGGRPYRHYFPGGAPDRD
jgi:glutathione S-transferase